MGSVQPFVGRFALELLRQFDVSDGDRERVPEVVRDDAGEFLQPLSLPFQPAPALGAFARGQEVPDHVAALVAAPALSDPRLVVTDREPVRDVDCPVVERRSEPFAVRFRRGLQPVGLRESVGVQSRLATGLDDEPARVAVWPSIRDPRSTLHRRIHVQTAIL